MTGGIIKSLTLSAILGVSSFGCSGCERKDAGEVGSEEAHDAGNGQKQDADKDAISEFGVRRGPNGLRRLPIYMIDDTDGRCGEFEQRWLLGPKSWRVEPEGLNIVKAFDHLYNNHNKDWRDRVELTSDEVIGCDYECLEACDGSLLAWLNDNPGQRCLKVGMIEKFRFKRAEVRQVEVSYHEGVNSWGGVDVLAGKGREEKNYVFRFRTERVIDEFVKDLGPYEREAEWKNKGGERVVQHIRKTGAKPVTHPKEKSKAKKYGRVLFSSEQSEFTIVDRRAGGDCRPDEVLAFLKSRDEVERRHKECAICSLEKDEVVGSYNLMNDAQKSLCDAAVLTKKELFCLLRECMYGCFGVFPYSEGKITCTGFLPKEKYTVKLTDIKKVGKGSFNEKKGYGSVTIKWYDKEARRPKRNKFIFRKEYQLRKFVGDLRRYVPK